MKNSFPAEFLFSKKRSSSSSSSISTSSVTSQSTLPEAPISPKMADSIKKMSSTKMPILSDSTVISEAEEVGVLHSTSQPGMLGQLVNLPVFDPTTISSEIEKYPQRQGFEIVELFFEVSTASFY